MFVSTWLGSWLANLYRGLWILRARCWQATYFLIVKCSERHYVRCCTCKSLIFVMQIKTLLSFTINSCVISQRCKVLVCLVCRIVDINFANRNKCIFTVNAQSFLSTFIQCWFHRAAIKCVKGRMETMWRYELYELDMAICIKISGAGGGGGPSYYFKVTHWLGCSSPILSRVAAGHVFMARQQSQLPGHDGVGEFQASFHIG